MVTDTNPSGDDNQANPDAQQRTDSGNDQSTPGDEQELEQAVTVMVPENPPEDPKDEIIPDIQAIL